MTVPRIRVKHGAFYWQPTPAVQALGFPARPLGKDPARALQMARDLNAQVDAAKAGLDPARRPADRSLAALIDAYQLSPTYQAKAVKTRQGYGAILREIRDRAGHLPVLAIDRPGLIMTYTKLRARGLHTANAHMRVWQILMRHAHDLGWRPDNPAARLGLETPPPRETVWTPDQIAAFCAAAVAQGRPMVRLGVLLAYDLGQRPGDVLRLSWANYTGSGFRLRQRKTGARVEVPFFNPFLWSEIDQLARRGALVILREGSDQPYTIDHFKHLVIEIRRAAGLPEGLQLRDLRRTAGSEWGDAGATDDQIRGAGGWATRNQVATYVRPSSAAARGAQEARRAARNGNR